MIKIGIIVISFVFMAMAYIESAIDGQPRLPVTHHVPNEINWIFGVALFVGMMVALWCAGYVHLSKQAKIEEKADQRDRLVKAIEEYSPGLSDIVIKMAEEGEND